MNYYEILGIDKIATKDEIKQAYRSLSKVYHPDTNKASNASTFFIMFTKAYETLYDDTTRKSYDESLLSVEPKAQSYQPSYEESNYDFTKQEYSHYNVHQTKQYEVSYPLGFKLIVLLVIVLSGWLWVSSGVLSFNMDFSSENSTQDYIDLSSIVFSLITGIIAGLRFSRLTTSFFTTFLFMIIPTTLLAPTSVTVLQRLFSVAEIYDVQYLIFTVGLITIILAALPCAIIALAKKIILVVRKLNKLN